VKALGCFAFAVGEHDGTSPEKPRKLTRYEVQPFFKQGPLLFKEALRNGRLLSTDSADLG
jgi:hypothetical protein